MSFQKYLDRLERVHLLIRRKATGSPNELASKLGLSERHTRECIAEMKEMGAPIIFDKLQNSYCYLRETHFEFGFKPLVDKEAANINAGFSFCTPTFYQ